MNFLSLESELLHVSAIKFVAIIITIHDSMSE